MKTFRLLTAAVALFCASTTYAQARHNGFSVILLVGDNQPAAGGDNLPPAPGVRKALADVKDFLPYKSYRVFDTQWMQKGSARMKGLDEQEYEVEITDLDDLMPNIAKTRPGVLRVVFKLQESGAASIPGEEYARSMQAADLEKQLAALRANKAELSVKYGEGNPAVVTAERRIADLEKRIRAVRAHKLIDSSFEMGVGETVVVGTSKVGGGDKGLVVLLTSVAGK